MPLSLAAAPAQMPLELVREDTERARDERDRPVGMPARAASGDLEQPPAQNLHVRRRAGPPDEALEARRDRGEPVDARSALARALVGEVARDACRLHDAARGLRKDDDRARAEGRADARERGIRERHGPRIGRADPGAEIASDEAGLRRRVGARLVEQPAERAAELDLV